MAQSKRTPGQVLQKAAPGRFQVQVLYYDKERRVFRPVPGHAVTFDVETPGDVRRLFGELERLVKTGRWREPGRGGGDPGGAAGVRRGAAAEPVDEE